MVGFLAEGGSTRCSTRVEDPSSTIAGEEESNHGRKTLNIMASLSVYVILCAKDV